MSKIERVLLWMLFVMSGFALHTIHNQAATIESQRTQIREMFKELQNRLDFIR